MQEGYKEVYFHAYCKNCKHYDKDKKCYEENKKHTNTCEECLSEPIKLYSHKPVKWEAKESK